MSALATLPLADGRKRIAAKSCTSLEPTNAPLDAMEKARALKAFVLGTPDQARVQAKDANAKIAKGDVGPLAGIPLGIKDLFATNEVRTVECSKILGNSIPP